MRKLSLMLIIAYTFCFETGFELAEKIDQRNKPNDIISNNKMILTDSENREKILELTSKSMNDSKLQMIWFLKPADDRGIAFIKIEKEKEEDFMSMWLPKYKRFRRISSSKKTDAFMGSDLSFEDLTNRSLDPLDYKYELLNSNINCTYNSKEYQGKCYELKSIPQDKNSEYQYHLTIVLNIKDDVYVSIIENSYDKKGKLLKEKEIIYNNDNPDYYIMNELYVRNVQDNHTTKLEVSKIDLNNGFTGNDFQERFLKRLP